jgi:hypothetical protein
MRSRGKGKKPLGDGGKKSEWPQILQKEAGKAGAEDDGEEAEDPHPIHLRSRVPTAHSVLKDILAERHGNWLAGIARNIRRNKSRGWRWTLNTAFSAMAGGIVAVLTGDPTAVIIAAAAGLGVPTVASTTRVRMSRLEAKRRDYPDLPEFRDDWAVACYELTCMIIGFNLRVAAIARLRRLAEEIDDERRADELDATADDIAELLSEWRPELIEIAELLAKYETDDLQSILTDAQTIATIRILNPLKDGRYDWLSLDPEIIPPGHEHELHDRDLREIACHQETVDAIDPYEALRREREKNGDPVD